MDTAAIIVDEAFVISDLHLGGEAPFQMFREGEALAGFIGGLIQPTGGRQLRRALVINGDFVDFLAEKPPRHFDPEGAVKKLSRIAEDPAFSPVFTALERFLAVPGNRLAIVLGNHDLELALPWVRQALEELLCGGDEAAAGRLVWSLDGQGVLLRIGSATGPRVLCAHGNEVDAWNVVEHETLRRMARDGLRGQKLETDYRPNAGSRMVIEVMNDIKQRFPFVDLLKPETQAVIPTLLALDPKVALTLRSLPALVGQQQVAGARIAAGFLGADTPSPLASPTAGVTYSDSAARTIDSKPARDAARQQASRQLMDFAEADFRTGRAAADLVNAAAREDPLGWGSAVFTLATGGDKVEALRAQLTELADDRTFSTLELDDTFKSMNDRVSTNIDYLVTGHTHLARAIEREVRRSYYFNTGTWARVFRIDPGILTDKAKFRKLFDVLGSASIESLDEAEGLISVRPHVAAFWQDETGTHGELRQVEATAPYRAIPVHGTQYSRS